MQSARVMVNEIGVESKGKVGAMTKHGTTNLVDK
jgi:hypothetical protein